MIFVPTCWAADILLISYDQGLSIGRSPLGLAPAVVVVVSLSLNSRVRDLELAGVERSNANP